MTTPSGLPKKALQWWGVASGAVNQRASTADVWAAINSAAAAQGQDSAGITLQGFNQLRSAAVQVRNSAAALTAGQDANGIDASMIGKAPWGRPIGDQNAAPQYQLRFLHTTTDMAGNEESAYRTIVFTGQLSATKAELLAQVERDAEALADKYNTDHVATAEHTIFAV